MPEAFQPDLLRQRLRPLTAAERDAQVLAYQSFYGLDLAARYPGLESRLGYFECAGYRIAGPATSSPERR